MADHLDLDRFLDSTHRLPDVPVGSAFDPWCLRVLDFSDFISLGDHPTQPSVLQLAYLAWLVILAPSTHNTVPIRLQIDEEQRTLDVWLNREFVLPASDPTGRQALVSLGCGIANAVLAARRYGFTTDVRGLPFSREAVLPHHPGQPKLTQVARLHFTRGDCSLDGAWIHAIRSRKIVRAEFDSRVQLDSDTQRALEGIAASFPGLHLHLLSDSPTLLCLAKFQELADTAVMNRDHFALELGHWLLEAADGSTIGMRGREFGLTEEVTHRLHLGLLRQLSLLPDEVAGFARAGNVGMRSSSAVAVLTVERDTPEAWLAAGRAYEEMALLLEQQRFCTAMHAGITEVDTPNLMLRGRLRTVNRPTVVFRIGRPLRAEDGLRAHSARPHLRDLLLESAVH